MLRYALLSEPEPRLLFACDRAGVRTFVEYLERLRVGRPTGAVPLNAMAGFDQRGGCEVVVAIDGQPSRAQLNLAGQIVWHFSDDSLDRALGLLRALAKSEEPGHQYLEEAGPTEIVVSMNEWTSGAWKDALRDELGFPCESRGSD